MSTTSLREDFVRLCDISIDATCDLKYRATEHGFGLKPFRTKSAGVKNCLTIIKSESGHIFGGYISGSWNCDNAWMNDPEAYLFSLINKLETPLKIKCSAPELAAKFSDLHFLPHTSDDYLQVYGRDLKLFRDSNINRVSFFKPGLSFGQQATALNQPPMVDTCIIIERAVSIVEIEMYSIQ